MWLLPSRRDFLVSSAGLSLAAAAASPRKIAAVTSVYRLNAHAEVIAGRLLEGYNLDGKNPRPNLQLVSLYVDQRPEGDLSRQVAKKHGLYMAPTIADALTLGGKDLA